MHKTTTGRKKQKNKPEVQYAQKETGTRTQDFKLNQDTFHALNVRYREVLEIRERRRAHAVHSAKTHWKTPRGHSALFLKTRLFYSHHKLQMMAKRAKCHINKHLKEIRGISQENVKRAISWHGPEDTKLMQNQTPYR